MEGELRSDSMLLCSRGEIFGPGFLALQDGKEERKPLECLFEESIICDSLMAG